MHPARRQRLFIVLFIVIGVSIAAALVMYALRDNINLFYPPEDVVAGKAPINTNIRVGGMVLEGSVERDSKSLAVHFVVTDYKAKVPVTYHGILPDLFAEGQGAVVKGQLQASGHFFADEVLAKHDENYMPPEVEDALKSSSYKSSK